MLLVKDFYNKSANKVVHIYAVHVLTCLSLYFSPIYHILFLWTVLLTSTSSNLCQAKFIYPAICASWGNYCSTYLWYLSLIDCQKSCNLFTWLFWIFLLELLDLVVFSLYGLWSPHLIIMPTLPNELPNIWRTHHDLFW